MVCAVRLSHPHGAKKTSGLTMPTPWEYHAALLPIRFRDESLPAGNDGGDITTTPETGRPCLVQYADETEQKRYLEAQLKLPWLPTEVRRAVMKALGRSQQDHNSRVERARTVTHARLVDEAAARMLAHRERPVGGVRTAALAEVAEAAGIDPETLAKRIQRAGHN
jgi:hypothetical protein